ncbi:MAG TPA: glycine dehydrogenase subunit 2 [Thermoplasmata archaeon]|nr:glycine dehydrogenase subunit 2 [Thermoplasmata archaeon]
MNKWIVPLINEVGSLNKSGVRLPDVKLPFDLPTDLKRKDLNLPGATEPEVVRHYTKLSKLNYAIDEGIYPLGSCTMKYNPKLGEQIANLPDVKNLHPSQDESTIQGLLEIGWSLERMLCEITGMDACTLQPAAGAQGELVGLLIARAYFEALKRGRTQVCLPDSAHGTNPASATMAGYEVIEIPSKKGRVDIDGLKKAVTENTAVFMLTNPNTLGLFEKDIKEIARVVHSKGALLYYDGANLNGLMGWARPGDMGFDIAHLNLHKTFASPHGGGGPGSGPICVKERLSDFLPIPRIKKSGTEERYSLEYDYPKSIGKIHSYYGNWGVIVRAYCYLLLMGNEIKKAAGQAVLNANYLKKKITQSGWYVEPYKDVCKHEFVLSCKKLLEKKGVRALNVAKRLLDYGVHPPTIYFPLIVPECLMIEPTETESKRELDNYAKILRDIAEEDAETLKNAPVSTPVKRVDEVQAARKPLLTWKELVSISAERK